MLLIRKNPKTSHKHAAKRQKKSHRNLKQKETILQTFHHGCVEMPPNMSTRVHEREMLQPCTFTHLCACAYTYLCFREIFQVLLLHLCEGQCFQHVLTHIYMFVEGFSFQIKLVSFPLLDFI